ncbi:ketoreductase domain-containing protein [Burkholderia glumae]|uniref:ketoreductase domain-containing protein n=1 Tax=Burkholderia glumae TaxID=337 RepID=UPI002036E4CE|nr:ketoreductase domain-containing protein [Burkholderia glumae]MCM2542540.1 ketoreductase domain-containing protein [Burkholderia glumae]
MARRHGARIDTLQLGLDDPEALREALRARLGGTPLAGVFHCAAVLDDQPFAAQAWEAAREVLRPKGAGAWHLHRATLGQPLDHFVVFSSLSALLGQPGQAAYALANALAEAVVERRRACGLPEDRASGPARRGRRGMRWVTQLRYIFKLTLIC